MSSLADLVGVSCEPLDDDGSLAVVDTVIEFVDGYAIAVHVELVGQKIRLFDDGDVVFHMLTRGVTLDERSDAQFITCLTEPEGVTLNDDAELEIWADPHEAHVAFTRFVSAMLAVVAWDANTRACVCMVDGKEKVVLVSDCT